MKKLLEAMVLAMAVGGAAYAEDVKAAPPNTVEVKKDERPVLEVAFVLDTTGSMSGLLEGAKQKIWSIASRMASGKPTPRIRVGLVAYRDRGDAYVTKAFDLTEDLDAVYKELRGYVADGGGDGPEHVGQALSDAVTKLSWSPDGKVARLIFLVGDAPSHDYGDGVTTTVWAKKAIEKGIVVNTIRCGADATTGAEWAKLAKLADGSFDSIQQGGGVVVAATPYDKDMAKLTADLADTSLVAGTVAVRASTAASVAEMKALPVTANADRVAYRGKMAAMAPAAAAAGSGGMLGFGTVGSLDLAEAPGRLATLKEEELPDQLRKVAPAERAAVVEKAAAQKKELTGKLNALAKQRDEYIAQKAEAGKDAFDERVFGSVKEKAAKVGVKY